MAKPNEKTVAKLRRLQKYILKEPRRFNLNFWGVHSEEDPESLRDSGVYDNEIVTILETQNPPCGTVACLAGNVCVMAKLVTPIDFEGHDLYEFDNSTPTQAQEYLGISMEDADNLFYLQTWGVVDGGWPKKFEKQLLKYTPGSKEYAQVGVDRIEHYIQTGR